MTPSDPLREALALMGNGWLDEYHPSEYGTPGTIDHMKRCPTCEEWSPCRVRMLHDAALSTPPPSLDPDANVWAMLDGEEHVAHRGNHDGYACGFSGPHCWACNEPWPCRAERARVLEGSPR